MPIAEQPLRAAEFDDLFAETLVRVDRPDATRVDLTLVGEPGLVQRVQALADRESTCCSFFEFTVTPSEPDAGADGTGRVAVHLGIAVPQARVDVLAAVVERAQAARAGGNRRAATSLGS
ncbi:MAG: hypothetical protein ACR2JU_03265 [Nocardioidaceae bacterium]